MTKPNPTQILNDIRHGNERLLAQTLTQIENDPHSCLDLLTLAYEESRKALLAGARVIGITGPPGAGKSTFLQEVLKCFHDDPSGILLIDPSSPVTGGALLGDRIRFQKKLSPHHFVRSLGSRGQLGGLSRATRDFIRVFLATGKKWIWVETVGVGQTETQIMHLVNWVSLLVTPDSGDVIQTMKAGILEVANNFVLNKIDLDSHHSMQHELENLPPLRKVFPVCSTQPSGIENFAKGLREDLQDLELNQVLKGFSQEDIKQEIWDYIAFELKTRSDQCFSKDKDWKQWVDQVHQGKKTPYDFDLELLKTLLK